VNLKCADKLGMNFVYQNNKTSSYKHGSANTFIPSFSPENLMTISAYILDFSGPYPYNTAAKIMP
jgi:hypothetical protein